jgi:hypothetical protein
LKRATEKTKKEYLERVCDKSIEFQRRCYGLMYVKTKALGWKENQVIHNTGIEDF